MRIDELKAQRIWVCFVIRKKGGGFDKKPISDYGTETGSDADHAHTWVTYDEAVKAMKEKGYDGIGFALPEGFFFVDIDHRNLTDPLLVTLLERFASYTEYSYSGNGVHIYGICVISKIPTYIDQIGKLRLDIEFTEQHNNRYNLHQEIEISSKIPINQYQIARKYGIINPSGITESIEKTSFLGCLRCIMPRTRTS